MFQEGSSGNPYRKNDRGEHELYLFEAFLSMRYYLKTYRGESYYWEVFQNLMLLLE